jgi:hypothetical protein
MTAFLITMAVVAALACLAAGALSPDRAFAFTVAASRLRYASGLAELAAGLAAVLAAGAACAAGGAAFLVSRAAAWACEQADRAALATLPVPILKGLADYG